jgi:hypothetical protein
MGAHVIWTGPVSAAQRQGATIGGATEHFLPCTGSDCRAEGEGWRDADGRHLPALLRQLGIPDGEDLYLGAFSAGGQAWKRLLEHPLDRAAIRAVALADAAYELADNDGRPASSPSLVDYAAEAAASGAQMLLATASANPNNVSGVAEPSGAATLDRIASDLGERLGSPLAMQSWIPGQGLDDLHPARVWLAGPDPRAPTVLLCDFGSTFRHEEHATVLAPRLWPAILQPWIDAQAGGGSPTPEGGDSGSETSGGADPSPGDEPSPAAGAGVIPTSPDDAPPTPAADADDTTSSGLRLGLALGACVGFAALVRACHRARVARATNPLALPRRFL